MLVLTHRVSSRALALPLLVGLIIVTGCTGSESTGPRSPARIEARSNTNISATVGTTVTPPLAVRVTDGRGRSVPSVAVTFSADSGDTISPESVATDADGFAETQLTVTTMAGGPHRVLARVAGVSEPAEFRVTATAGPLTRVVLATHAARVPTRIDTLRLAVVAEDAYGNRAAGAIAWTTRDASVLAVDATGLVRVVQHSGAAWVVASGGRAAADSTLVSAPPSPCVSTAATTMSPGQVIADVSSESVCLRGGTADGQYALVLFFSSPLAGGAAQVDVTAHGVGAPPWEPGLGPQPVVPGAIGAALSNGRRPDWALEAALMQRGRADLTARFAAARQQLGTRALAREVAPPAVRASVRVGDIISLNENLNDACQNPLAGRARVAAISEKAVVLSDVASPPGGFTDAELQSFATTFDTLVYPLDAQTFGEPTDIDGNARVVIFFTPAVNALTPPGSAGFVAGVSGERDLLPASSCPASNQGEMFYLVVPDPTGSVNGNVRDKELVSEDTYRVLGHELQHVTNFARRLYVNGASIQEEVWLNEGLSHIAEELLFYRESGAASRQNVGSLLPPTFAFGATFDRYQWPNVADYFDYLADPSNNSPYGDVELSRAGRGAAWSFLRYAADRRAPADGDFWYRLVNSQASGRMNVAQVLGIDGRELTALFRDWAVSLYADDFAPGVAGVFSQPSWNFRAMLSGWFLSTGPFIEDLPLRDETRTPVLLADGGTIPAPFTVPAYQDVLVAITSGGGTIPPGVMVSLVRVR